MFVCFPHPPALCSTSPQYPHQNASTKNCSIFAKTWFSHVLSTTHIGVNIESSCNDGTCSVAFNQNQVDAETINQEPQQIQQENYMNHEENVMNQGFNVA